MVVIEGKISLQLKWHATRRGFIPNIFGLSIKSPQGLLRLLHGTFPTVVQRHGTWW